MHGESLESAIHLAGLALGAVTILLFLSNYRDHRRGTISHARYVDVNVMVVGILLLSMMSFAPLLIRIGLLCMEFGALGLYFGRRWGRREELADRAPGAAHAS